MNLFIKLLTSVELNLYSYSNLNDYCVLGIDPGKNLGISILTVSIVNNIHVIKDVKTFTIDLNVSVKDDTITTIQRTNYLREYLYSLLTTVQPVAVCMETVFKSKFANAVIQLSQYVVTIEQTIHNFNPYIKVFKLAPKLIKKIVGTKGDSTKDDMMASVSKIEELKPFVNNNQTEHEIDSLAMAFIAYDTVKKYPECIFMNLNYEIK